MDAAHSALRSVFGFEAFRPGQAEAVRAVTGPGPPRDVLVVMPTGAGKSLCYQLPALVRDDLTLVVSPLVSLMQDQVEALGGRAALVNSQQDPMTNQAALDAACRGDVRLLYVAPERFGSPGFLDAVKDRVGLFVVDEAHCVSQWGHDFRPDYFRLADAARYLGAKAIVASTATATPTVARDIERRLGLREPAIVTTGFDRPNLDFAVIRVASTKAKHRRIAAALAEEGATPAIVYAGTRAGVDRLARSLSADLDREVLAYHAGLGRAPRAEAQRRFMSGEVDVVVATNAFGMGVDKADVRTVVHESVPGSLEAYYQEACRAGRDGQPSRALLFAESRDKGLHVFFIQRSEVDDALVERVARTLEFRGLDGRYDVEVRELANDPDEHERLRAVIGHLAQAGVIAPTPSPADRMRGRILTPFDGRARAATRTLVADGTRARWRQYRAIWAYVEGETCRRQAILSHFGDRLAPVAHGACCDVCAPELVAGLPQPAGRARSASGGAVPVEIDDAIVSTVEAAEPACGR